METKKKGIGFAKETFKKEVVKKVKAFSAKPSMKLPRHRYFRLWPML